MGWREWKKITNEEKESEKESESVVESEGEQEIEMEIKIWKVQIHRKEERCGGERVSA